MSARITLKLFASLQKYLPRELDGHVAVGHELPVEIADGTAVQDVIDRFQLPADVVHLVLVNGAYVPPSQRRRHVLRAGDALAIWPMIAGG